LGDLTLPDIHDPTTTITTKATTTTTTTTTMTTICRQIGDRAFSVAAPQAWNRLPTELKLL